MAQERNANVVLTADVDPYRQSIRAAGNDTNKLTQQIDKLAQSLDRLSKSAGRKLSFLGVGSVAGITATTVAYAAFDKQMTSLRVNAEVTGRSYDKMSRNVNNLRRDFGLATSTAAQLHKTILGFRDSTGSVDKLSTTFTKLGLAVGEAPDTLARGMLQLQRSMSAPQKDTERYANVLADLSIKSGLAAGSILDFSQVIAPIGRIAGMTTTEILGVSTAFNKAGQDGYMAANAFNKMLSDIMRSTQDGSPDLAKYSNLIGVTVSQFKEMEKTEAITQIFDELNRMGPNAIQVLNRMGLDGMRMQRAIAGVSQQTGGIGTSVAQAVAAYNAGGDNALNKGSKEAIDGVSDQMARLAESTKQMGEAMGQVFQGPAKFFLSSMRELTESLGTLAGSTGGKAIAWLGALGAAAALAGGPLLKLAGGLATLATVRGLTTNWMTSGFRDGRAGDAVTATGRAYERNPAATNFAQRGFYNLGQWMGTRVPFNPLQTIIAGGARGAAVGADFMRGIYAPLTHPFSSMNRPRIFATTEERATGRAVGGIFSSSIVRGAANTDWRGSWAQARGGNIGGAVSNLWTSGMGQAGRLFPSPPMLSSPSRELANAGVRIAGLTGTIGGAALGATGVAAQLGFRGLQAGVGALGTGIASLGPLGAAMIGIPLAMAARSKMAAANEVGVGTGEDNISLMDSYRAAVGEATSATLDFASALRNSIPDGPTSRKRALTVTEEDKARAQTAKFTNEQMDKISRSQATNLLRGSIRSGASAETIDTMKIDLIKAFGGREAEQIIAAARGRGSFNTNQYVASLAASGNTSADRWFGLKAGENADPQYRLLEGQFKAIQGDAIGRGGNAAGIESRKVLTNQFLSSFFGRYDDMTKGSRDAGFRFINKTLFGGGIDLGDEGGLKGPLAWLNKGVDWQQYAIDANPVAKAFKKSKTAGLQEFYGQMAGSDHEGTRKAFKRMIGDLNLTRGEAMAQIESGQGSLFNSNMRVARNLMGANVTGTEAYRNRIMGTEAGMVWNTSGAMDLINKAVQTPGDQNLQIQAMDEMVRSLKKAGSGFADVDRQLIAFQAAVQDPTDELYKLAAAARGISAQNLEFRLPYMGSGDRFYAQSQLFMGRMSQLTPGPGVDLPPDAEAQRKDVVRGQKQLELANRDRVLQMFRQQQEFDIAKRRADYDYYQIQLPRMEQQFNLSRERSWEDYNISRSRAEEEFAISQQRSAQQYRISLKDSYQDFHISRTRAEKDFAHQQQLLAKQMAQQQYNIYDRLKVQRTWAAPGLLQNSQEQLQQMRQQNNDLDRLRKMGMSKLAIQQMNFTSPENAQQLERFVADAKDQPGLIRQINQQSRQRLRQGKELATDPANPQWDEMRRQFRLSMSRGADDFERAMSRNRRNYSISMQQAQSDFGRSMKNNAADMKRAMKRSADDYDLAISNMTSDFERQQRRAAKDLGRMQKELTWSFAQTMEKALKTLSGGAKEQVQVIYDTWKTVQDFLKNNELEFKLSVDWRNDPGVRRGLGEDPANPPARTNHTGGVYRGSQLVWVAETANEAVVPLNRHGAAFMSAVLSQYAGDAKQARVSGHNTPITPVGSGVQNYRIDKSTNFSGPVHVHGVENPRQMAEKARIEARKKKLTKGTR